MRVTAIVLAAGRGVRLRSKVPKPLIQINARPVIFYSLTCFDRHPDIDEIIVVAGSENIASIKACIAKYCFKKVSKVVLGGKRRQDSVAEGLKAAGKDSTVVLIHDVARPFVSSRIVSDVLKRARRTGAAIAAVAVKCTIKKVKRTSRKAAGLFVEKTLDRDCLYEIQTPQAFRKGLLIRAYERFGKLDVTDDAMLLEKCAVKVSVVEGAYDNIKITTPEDVAVAQAIIKSKRP